MPGQLFTSRGGSTSRSQTWKPSTGRSGIAHDRLLRRACLARREEPEADARRHARGDRSRQQSEYLTALIDQLEATRRELLELRATEVWVGDLPERVTLASEPSTRRHLVRSQEAALQGPLHAWPRIRPGRFVSCSSLLRADVVVLLAFRCDLRAGSTRTRNERVRGQQAGPRGMPAGWTGRVDRSGPAFASHLGGSDEERGREAERVPATTRSRPSRGRLGRVRTITMVCSTCMRIQPCACHAKQRQRRAARDSVVVRPATSGLDATPGTGNECGSSASTSPGHYCELQHTGCTLRATTVHLLSADNNHATARLEETRAACLHCHGVEDGGKKRAGFWAAASTTPTPGRGEKTRKAA